MLDLKLAHTYAPVVVCLLKTCIMCSIMYAMRGAGVPSLNVHVTLGCLLFLDRTYYTERIFSTNIFAAFVLFAFVLNEERGHHNRDKNRSTVAIVLNVIWACVGMVSLLNVHERVYVLRHVRFNPLVASCAFLVIHSFMYCDPEHEVVMFGRAILFLMLSLAWIYLFNAPRMKASRVYNATECMVHFGYIMFTALPVATGASVMCFAVFSMMHRRTHREFLSDHYSVQGESSCGYNSSDDDFPPVDAFDIESREEIEARETKVTFAPQEATTVEIPSVSKLPSSEDLEMLKIAIAARGSK